MGFDPLTMVIGFIDGSVPSLTNKVWGAPDAKLFELAQKLVTGAGSPGGAEITTDERGYLIQAGCTMYCEARQIAALANGSIPFFLQIKSDDWLARQIQIGALKMARLGGVSWDDGTFPPEMRLPDIEGEPTGNVAEAPKKGK